MVIRESVREEDEDRVTNPWPALDKQQIRESVGEQSLRHPNMNNTGRLPGFAMFHVGMRVRLTQPVEPPEAVVDASGSVRGLDFHPSNLAVIGVAFSRARCRRRC